MEKRLAELEEAVYNQGRANAVFEDIRDRITKNETTRKVDIEEVRNRMTNVEHKVDNQNFIVEQLSKQFETAVRSCR